MRLLLLASAKLLLQPWPAHHVHYHHHVQNNLHQNNQAKAATCCLDMLLNCTTTEPCGCSAYRGADRTRHAQETHCTTWRPQQRLLRSSMLHRVQRRLLPLQHAR